ncbi:MAG: iron permease [Actinomycetia bacterium]|nr:iron permease [Actinomycetes bacterium]
MGESFLIILREGFEGCLIVAIVLAYLRSIGRLDLSRTIWAGVLLAAGIALGLGILLNTVVDGLEGAARMRTFAVIAFAAAAVLTWMVFWMRRQSMNIKGELQHAIDTALDQGHVGRALFLVAFFAVLREGIETALFMVAAATGANTLDILIGGGLGLAGAIALGVLIYQGGRKVPMRQFFKVTGFLVIIFAAGLAAKGVMFLQASGDLRSMNYAFYDVTSVHWLTSSSEIGKFLAGIFGWDPRPSIEQVVVWLAVLVPLCFLFTRQPASSAPAKPTAEPTPVTAS